MHQPYFTVVTSNKYKPKIFSGAKAEQDTASEADVQVPTASL